MVGRRRRRHESGLGFLGRQSQSTWGTNSAVVRPCSISGAAARPWRVSPLREAARVGGLLKHRNRVRNEEWDADVRGPPPRPYSIQVKASLRER